MLTEGPWIENGFKGFINSMDKKALFAQLHMFSPEYNINQAIEFLQKNKVFILQTEHLANDFAKLSNCLSIKLEVSNQKSYDFKSPVSEDELIYARDILEPEYQFLSKLKQIE